jgi:hypothetical protein
MKTTSWLKAFLKERLLLKAWPEYLEGRKKDQQSARDKKTLDDLVTKVLESEDGQLRGEWQALLWTYSSALNTSFSIMRWVPRIWLKS